MTAAAVRATAPLLVLLLAGLIWGATFVVTEGALDAVSAWGLLAYRFGLAAVVLLVLAGPRLCRLAAVQVRQAILTGLLLGLGFGAQTLGLELTSAAANGFVTGLMVVLTPLLARVLFGRRFNALTWLGVGPGRPGPGRAVLTGWR